MKNYFKILCIVYWEWAKELWKHDKNAIYYLSSYLLQIFLFALILVLNPVWIIVKIVVSPFGAYKLYKNPDWQKKTLDRWFFNKKTI